MPNRLLPAQIRGARGMLNWSMLDLAKASGVSVSTVKRIEKTEPQAVSDEAYKTVEAALHHAGVRLLEDEGGGVGVRLMTR